MELVEQALEEIRGLPWFTLASLLTAAVFYIPLGSLVLFAMWNLGFQFIGFRLLAGLFAVGLVLPVLSVESWLTTSLVSSDRVSLFGSHVFTLLVARLFAGVLIGAGLLVFVVPGVYLAGRLASYPARVCRGDGLVDGLKEAWQDAEGRTLQVILQGALYVVMGVSAAAVIVLPLYFVYDVVPTAATSLDGLMAASLVGVLAVFAWVVVAVTAATFHVAVFREGRHRHLL